MLYLIFLNSVSADDKNLGNVVDFGYSEWVCLNENLIFTKNSAEFEKSLINYHGAISKKTNEFKASSSENLYPFLLHHYFFKNKNEVIWLEIKNPVADNNIVVSTRINKEGFPISKDLYLGNTAEKFGKKINKKITNLNGSYKLGCDLISLNILLKNGKIVFAEWQSMIN